MRSRLLALFATIGLAVGLVWVLQPSAQAASTPSVVSEYTAAQTPNVLDGRVNAVVKIGDTMVIGGDFSQIQAASGGPVLTRNNLAAFDATTGAISTTFVPNPDGVVDALDNAPDGTSVYVGGHFTNIAGKSSASLARLTVSNGAGVAGFHRPSIRGYVADLRFSQGRLWIAGNFTSVAGHDQQILATLNGDSGDYDPFMGLTFASPRSTPRVPGKLRVIKLDQAPDGSSFVVIGNFTTVNGQSRSQVAKISTTGSQAALSGWNTRFYTSTCSQSFDTYMRDVDYSPDGSYFVIGTTGAYGGSTSGCDVVARFETGSTSSDAQPTWTDYTGGDTTFTVEVTKDAVYTGGHFRWQNNAFAADRPGRGAVAREGLAALDPENGLPLNWNPGRAKGVGVFAMLATSDGLWVGSDTDRIGHFAHHAKIAFFPLAGGEVIPAKQVGAVPGTVWRGGTSSSSDSLTSRNFDGSTADAGTGGPSGVAWSRVRGAFMIGDTLYTGGTDGKLMARSFDGKTFGSAAPVDTAEQLVAEDFATNTLTGMYYAKGQIYYTSANNAGLYSRAFTPSSGVVGTVRRTVSGNVAGINFANVQGMFVSGDKLYTADARTGALNRTTLSGDVPVANSTVTVSSPAKDNREWQGNALFLGAGKAGPNAAPTAVAAARCAGLTCSVSSAGSADSDGSIASYSWNFGDNSTATGDAVEHRFTAAGDYTITLTVTDDRGATGTSTQKVTVAPVATPLAFVGGDASRNNGTKFTVTVPAAAASGDVALVFATTNTAAAIPEPTGLASFTALGDKSDGSISNRAWATRLGAGDAGKTVTLSLPALAKTGLSVVVYRGVDPAELTAAKAVAGETSTTKEHAAPALPAGDGLLVNYWADKSSATTALTPPAGLVTRLKGQSTGGGHITALIADSGSPLPAGPIAAKSATADSASSHAIGWSVLLRAAK